MAQGDLAELEAVIERLCAADPHTLAEASTLEVLHRCEARLEAVTTRATAAF